MKQEPINAHSHIMSILVVRSACGAAGGVCCHSSYSVQQGGSCRATTNTCSTQSPARTEQGASEGAHVVSGGIVPQTVEVHNAAGQYWSRSEVR